MASVITTKAMMSHHHVLSSTKITTLYSDISIDNQQIKAKPQIPHRFFSRSFSGVTRAVINSPAPSPTPDKEKVEGERRCHVAWTSVQQEKWEGELTVQGNIPTWLVCLLSSIFLQISFNHIRGNLYKYVSCTQNTLILSHAYVYIQDKTIII